MWSVSEMARDKFGTYWIRCGTGQGFSREPDTINGGGNSGYQAIHLAATFGAKKIVLLGFDMQRTGGREHWHGKHEGNLPHGAGFGSWMKSMAFLAADLRRMGVDVVNCSRVTAMRCFRRATLEEIFDETQRHPDDGSQTATRVSTGVAVGDV